MYEFARDEYLLQLNVKDVNALRTAAALIEAQEKQIKELKRRIEVMEG